MKKALFLSLIFTSTSMFTSEEETPNRLILDFKIASTEINKTWKNIANTVKNIANNPDKITKESSIELIKNICLQAKKSIESKTGLIDSIDINMFATSDASENDFSTQEEHSGFIRLAFSKTDNCSDELWTTIIEKTQQLFASDKTEELTNNQIIIADVTILKLNEFNDIINESKGQLIGSTFISLIE